MVCFLRTPNLSLQPFVPYPAIRKKKHLSAPHTFICHSQTEFEEQQRLPGSVTVWSNHCIHNRNLLCEAWRTSAASLPGWVFPVCGGGATVSTDLLGIQVCKSNCPPTPFFRLTFRDLHDLPHLCPKGTGMCAGIISVIVTWMGELLNKY